MKLSNKKSSYIVLDQGTSGTKAFLFSKNGHVLFSKKVKHSLYKPAPHNVECDPSIILNACISLLHSMVEFADDNQLSIISAGLTVQRSTFMFWEKDSGKIRTPAISWQDSRAKKEADEKQDLADFIWGKTGTPLSAHFGGPKYVHFTRQDSSLKSDTENGKVLFGPISAFISHQLTGNPFLDESIACRSLFVNLETSDWDDALLDIFDMPRNGLPELRPTIAKYGHIKIRARSFPLKTVIGDQQAALIGQTGLNPGALAMNFGTSGSVQFNGGSKPGGTTGLISSVLASDDSFRHYLFEGTINACNSLFYHLEDVLNISHKDMKWDQRCENQNTDGIYIPGFAGLASPYWVSGITDFMYNLDENNQNEIVRAGMESIGFLTADIYEIISKKVDTAPKMIPASGGGARPVLLQFLADLLHISMGHTAMKDRTAYGVYKILSEKAFDQEMVECDQIFTPQMNEENRKTKLDQWHSALKQA